jgi:hypothetical protein
VVICDLDITLKTFSSKFKKQHFRIKGKKHYYRLHVHNLKRKHERGSSIEAHENEGREEETFIIIILKKKVTKIT